LTTILDLHYFLDARGYLIIFFEEALQIRVLWKMPFTESAIGGIDP
jgi:hypothetical protein